MTTRGLTRGPLPSSVYWRRRALVGVVAALLVVGIAQLLGAGGSGSGSGQPDGSAQLVGAPASSSAPAGTSSPSPTARPTRAARPRTSPTPLAEPTGVCRDRDVKVVPTVERPEAGRDVVITLSLRTDTTPACTWSPSAQHLTVKISRAADDVWSSRQCPGALPGGEVTVRQAVATRVRVVWNGRLSDDECSRLTAWALPATYRVAAAAFAGEPATARFQLGTPGPVVVTRTASPTATPSGRPSSKPSGRPSKPSSTPAR
ncbi:hypothetical protein K8Z61_10190 [Nocardioides sp. TRM66260-LWL]|uniref:hypothetical protein n=1 Tax=Nocardioides sp. TRM66260-LWL TaxID=2874478 RepID=UPI001CC5065B|nr:hypothetical protein [Nocardioides sp. TRM66260-LWL]MBZ5734864.1 hypothetical protein [Nocardioides sp. TRM66260-LWL]